MTLQESGQFCEAVMEYEQEKIFTQIRIFAAFAVDINTYYSQFKDKKNKYIPIAKMFPEVFTGKQDTFSDDEKEHRAAITWLEFLGKTELMERSG